MTDNATGKSIDLPVIEGSVGPKVIDVRKLYAQTGYFTYDPGFMATAACRSSITYIDGDEGILHVSRLSDRGAGRQERLPRSRLSAAQRRVADRRSKRRSSSVRHHAPHDGARADRDVFPRLPARRAPDGGAVRRGRRAVGVLPRLDRHQRPVPADGRLAPADRQAADDRRDGLQIFARPALYVSEELARIRRELPPHDLRGAVRGVQGQSGPGEGDGPDLHPARRPRAERLDRDRAQRRLVAAPTRSPASPPASPRYGARRMAAPTRRC